ncbi:MFS transporter [Vibrio qinghaiensis]|uniref:MFS transporter n=2 Tax=Vibrionaceae TaxID=641 RepID=A0A223N0W1_9VIBR|nr:MFS transporter [Vibrio qinghaiensis]
MNKENLARYFQFALVILAGGSIFPLVYLKAQYQETILEVFSMSMGQMNTIYTILGFVFLIGYFPSGVLCDRFSAKKLLAVSLLGTAAGGFWFAQVPSYTSVLIIFAIWGFSSVFTFWGAHLKITKMLAKEGEEGRFFGILDGGRGLVEAVLASIGLVIFTSVLGGSIEFSDKKQALESVIYMYSIALVIAAVLIMIFVKEDKEVTAATSEDSKIKLSDIGKVFKNKLVYLHGLIIFAGYTIFWTSYYIGGYLQTSLGFDAVTVGSMMVGLLWMRPIGGVLGGFLADKLGQANTIAAGILGGVVCLGALVVAPSSLPTYLITALVMVTGLFSYIIRGTYWSLLGQSKIDAAIMGTAIGVISVVGYIPDIIIPEMNTVLWDIYGNEGGYHAYFIVSMMVGLVGFVLTMLYKREQKKTSEVSFKSDNEKL